jgi:hypothetical protein
MADHLEWFDYEQAPRDHIRETQAELVDRRMREEEVRWAEAEAAFAGQRVPCACLPAGDYSPQDIANGRGGR